MLTASTLSTLLPAAIIPGVGGWEFVIILVIVLIIFGPKSLPALGRALGKGLKEFKSASSKLTDALDDAAREDEVRHDERNAAPRAAAQIAQEPARPAVVATPTAPAHSVAVPTSSPEDRS